MARTPKRVEITDPLETDQGDYRPREFGRITWLVKLAEREVHRERASSAALARTVFVTPQAMVGIVAGLERKGFIRRKSSKVSARAIDATVTAAGKTVYAEAVRMIRNVDDILAKEFSSTELEQ